MKSHLLIQKWLLVATLCAGTAVIHADPPASTEPNPPATTEPTPTPPAPPPPPVECGRPVCDIPAKVEEMRKADQDERFRIVSAIRKKYQDTTKVSDLRNLKEFGLAARKMCQDLKLNEENDYDFGAVLAVLDIAVTGLSLYDVPEAKALIENYKTIFYAASRFKILNYWNRRAEGLESTAALIALTDFASAARRYSEEVETGEEKDYIPKAALTLQERASSRYLFIYPIFEGVYDVHFRCSAGANCGRLPSEGKMVVLNSLSDAKIITQFLDSKNTDGQRYDFASTRVENAARTLEGATEPKVRSGVVIPVLPAEFRVDFDHKNRTVSGWVKDSLSQGFIRVDGHQVATPAEFLIGAGAPQPIRPEESTGVFEGQLTSVTGEQHYGRLTVKKMKIPNNRLVAVFRDTDGKLTEFWQGEFIKKYNALAFVHVAGNERFIRWTLAFRNGRWSGAGFSSVNGDHFRLSFSRVSDIVEPPPGEGGDTTP